jgi:ABC-type glycerol-3-phosphate transport system permease component
VAEHLQAQVAGSQVLGRFVVYGLLVLLALYYLMPLFVMLSTSV